MTRVLDEDEVRIGDVRREIHRVLGGGQAIRAPADDQRWRADFRKARQRVEFITGGKIAVGNARRTRAKFVFGALT